MNLNILLCSISGKPVSQSTHVYRKTFKAVPQSTVTRLYLYPWDTDQPWYADASAWCHNNNKCSQDIRIIIVIVNRIIIVTLIVVVIVIIIIIILHITAKWLRNGISCQRLIYEADRIRRGRPDMIDLALQKRTPVTLSSTRTIKHSKCHRSHWSQWCEGDTEVMWWLLKPVDRWLPIHSLP